MTVLTIEKVRELAISAGVHLDLATSDVTQKLVQLAYEKGRADERDACAAWYNLYGWLLDENEVAMAMRDRQE